MPNELSTRQRRMQAHERSRRFWFEEAQLLRGDRDNLSLRLAARIHRCNELYDENERLKGSLRALQFAYDHLHDRLDATIAEGYEVCGLADRLQAQVDDLSDHITHMEEAQGFSAAHDAATPSMDELKAMASRSPASAIRDHDYTASESPGITHRSHAERARFAAEMAGRTLAPGTHTVES